MRGSLDGRVMLVEYGDYECPYCRVAHSEVLQLVKHFGDELTYVFRHFSLTEIHPLVEPAAEAAEFAAAGGRFWDMHDAIYAHQDQLSLPFLLGATQALGLPESALALALEAKTFAPKVEKYFLSGVRSGVNGTPTFFINGRRHDGPFDYRHLADAIQSVRPRI